MAGEIISERWARSFRSGGRNHSQNRGRLGRFFIDGRQHAKQHGNYESDRRLDPDRAFARELCEFRAESKLYSSRADIQLWYGQR
jgi:hypothetical protein